MLNFRERAALLMMVDGDVVEVEYGRSFPATCHAQHATTCCACQVFGKALQLSTSTRSLLMFIIIAALSLIMTRKVQPFYAN